MRTASLAAALAAPEFAKFADGKPAGVVAAKDPTQTARTLLDATNALLPYSLSAYELGERSDIEKKAKMVADLLLNGLCRRA